MKGGFMKQYNIVLTMLAITQKLLMSTCKDLDRVRNKKNRTEEDEDIMNWILLMRKPIEIEQDRLESLRQKLWKEEYHN